MWKVPVILYEKTTDDGIHCTHRIDYATPRAMFDAGICNVGRQPLAVIEILAKQDSKEYFTVRPV
jgi:hypothetical protein